METESIAQCHGRVVPRLGLISHTACCCGGGEEGDDDCEAGENGVRAAARRVIEWAL